MAYFNPGLLFEEEQLYDTMFDFTVAKLWDRFNKKEYRKIRDIRDCSGGYGVFLPFPKCEGDYSYIAGFSTKENAPLPEGMVFQVLPASKYAVFTYVSPMRNKFDMTKIPSLYWYIFNKWLPISEFSYNDTGFVFEYFQRHRMMIEYPEYDIYIPIVKI